MPGCTKLSRENNAAQKHTVYGLKDPRTDEVRYIGMTVNVTQRFSYHISRIDKSNQTKQSWLDDLKANSLQPDLIIIEDNLDRQEAFVREKYWLQIYLEQGANLTNMRDAELLPWELRVDHP
jgi:predicted GIY-YIG superfamily endonuclease